jgi:hypothetical protein
MVTKDTLLGLEVSWWAPLGEDDCHFIIQRKKIFKYSDKTCNSIYIGDFVDWDIPESSGNDRSGFDNDYNLIYQYGSGYGCLDNERRFGAITFLGAYNHSKTFITSTPYGAHTEPIADYVIQEEQILDQEPLYYIIGQAGYSVWGVPYDIFSCMTHIADYDLQQDDTLYVYSAFISLLDGTVDDLRDNVIRARVWACDYLGCEWAFTCGDTDGDDMVNILDIVYLINYLYKGGAAPEPVISADADGDGSINILDVVYIINYIYKNGAALICEG